MRRSNLGYSLIEMMTVIALTMVGSAVAIIQIKGSMTTLNSSIASSLVIEQLKYAREIAIDERKNVRIQFIAPATIKVSRIETNGSATLLATSTLPSGYSFGLPTGMGDTPDGYGNVNAVYFNNSTTGTFLGDGILTDGAGIVISGTVFTIGGGNATSRAVTLSGASGRTKQYYIKNSTWTEQR